MIIEEGTPAEFKECVLTEVTTLACGSCGAVYITQKANCWMVSCERCAPEMVIAHPNPV